LEVAFIEDNAMPLYYLVLHVWLWVGDSEFILRSLSLIFAASSVAAVWLLGTTVFGRRVGLLSALIMATVPLLIGYAQEARGYTLVLLLSIVASLLLIRASLTNRPGSWLSYGVVAVAAGITHQQAMFVLVAHAAFIITRRRFRWRGWSTIPIAIPVLLAIPGLLVFSQRTSEFQPPPVSGLDSLILFRAGAGLPFAIIGFVSLLIGALTVVRRDGSSEKDLRHDGLVLLLLWFFLPLFFRWLLSGSLNLTPSRYVIVSTAPLMLLVAVMIDKLRHDLMRLAALAVVLACLLPATIAKFSSGDKSDWRGATHYVLKESSSEDGIAFFSPGISAAFAYYARDDSDRLSFIYPDEGFRTTYSGSAPSDMSPPPPSLIAELADHDRIWLVTAHLPKFGDPRARIFVRFLRHLRAQNRREESKKTFGGISVQLWVSREGP
jgi:hypothetical protein